MKCKCDKSKINPDWTNYLKYITKTKGNNKLTYNEFEEKFSVYKKKMT